MAEVDQVVLVVLKKLFEIKLKMAHRAALCALLNLSFQKG
jgi:hypothetical protein